MKAIEEVIFNKKLTQFEGPGKIFHILYFENRNFRLNFIHWYTTAHEYSFLPCNSKEQLRKDLEMRKEQTKNNPILVSC